ncbi:MAG: hypothetical protein QW570_07815 [Candidatus Caldarchaeum sp.]
MLRITTMGDRNDTTMNDYDEIEKIADNKACNSGGIGGIRDAIYDTSNVYRYIYIYKYLRKCRQDFYRAVNNKPTGLVLKRISQKFCSELSVYFSLGNRSHTPPLISYIFLSRLFKI